MRRLFSRGCAQDPTGQPSPQRGPRRLAKSIAGRRKTFLAVKYRRLARSRGKQKAIVATERTLLTISWTMLTTGALYDEPGPDWSSRQHPDRAKHRALRQLHDLGYDDTLTPVGAA